MRRKWNSDFYERPIITQGCTREPNRSQAFSRKSTNLPVIFAGGGFRHGQHLAFDTERNYPLPNLYVSMLQQLGIETDRFASSTGTMRGLEMT